MTWEQVVSLVASPVIAAVVSWWLNRDLKDQVRTQASQLAELKDRRVAAVEDEVKALQSNGCTVGRVVGTKLTTLVEQGNELLRGVNELQRQGAAQGERIESLDRSASKIWEKFDEHRQHHPGKSAGV